MIKKILSLKNVGLFQNGCPSGAVDFQQTTLIYAENGRGKSTLASVFRSCDLSDATRLLARQTLDATGPLEVQLLYGNNTQHRFISGAWTGASLSIVVFDSEFVEQNVYSGFAVRPEQRQSLLDFALGDTSVQLKQRIDQLTEQIQVLTTQISASERQLRSAASPLSIEQFLSLQPIADATLLLNQVQSRITASNNAQALISRDDPVQLPLVNIDLVNVGTVLTRQLEDVEKSAATAVETHISKYPGTDIENWLSTGQLFAQTDSCPFCGQGLDASSLVTAYQVYFNQEYRQLKSEIAGLERHSTLLSESQVNALAAKASINEARVEAWQDLLSVTPPMLDAENLRNSFSAAHTLLVDLIQRKLSSPLEDVVNPTDIVALRAAVEQANLQIANYNSSLSEALDIITNQKARLQSEDVTELRNSIQRIEAAQRRYEEDYEKLCNDYQAWKAEKTALEEEKTQVRGQLDALMSATLTQYQTAINDILARFGAGFSIERMAPNYRGRAGEPRTDYGLKVRDRSVQLGTSADFATGPNFSTTLSEADKRSLALAFFLARLQADPALGSKIVVLDDPVSSMDRNRRFETTRLLTSMSSRCSQLIVLSHDAYFLRELRDKLQGVDTSVQMSLLGVVRVQNGYSALGSCDLDDVCSSDYYRHYRIVAEYVDGTSPVDIRDVAKAIRLLIEGNLHRRFPLHIPRRQMLGKIIADQIAVANTEPLIRLQPVIQELREINEYASQFHHDTNPQADAVHIADSELLGYAQRVLNLIH